MKDFDIEVIRIGNDDRQEVTLYARELLIRTFHTHIYIDYKVNFVN